MEQCERISLRNVHTIAEALEASAEQLRAARQQRTVPFSVWADSRAFSAKAKRRAQARGKSGLDSAALGADASVEASAAPSQADEEAVSVSAASGPSQACTVYHVTFCFAVVFVNSYLVLGMDMTLLKDCAVTLVSTVHRLHSQRVLQTTASTAVVTQAATSAAAAATTAEPAAPGQPPGAAKPVYLLSTRHIVRVWAAYGSLLPVLRGTADAPLLVLRAVQSLFEEFMLWIVIAFANVNPEAVVWGLGGTHDRFFQVRIDQPPTCASVKPSVLLCRPRILLLSFSTWCLCLPRCRVRSLRPPHGCRQLLSALLQAWALRASVTQASNRIIHLDVC
jgi:hypothetical protein